MAELTLEQKRAMAMAQARLRMQQQAEPTSIAEDVALSGATGLGQGFLSLMSMTNPFQVHNPAANPRNMQSMIEKVTGPWHEPETVPGEYARTVGQFAPGVVGGGSLANRVLTNVAIPALSSETAGQVARKVAPDYETAARVGGGILGGLSGASVQQKLAQRGADKALRSVDDLEVAKRAAYQEVDELGATYSQNAFDRLVGNIEKAAKAKHIHPKRHPKASSLIEDLAAERGKTPTLTELDQWRQVVRRDVAKDAAEETFGDIIIDEIDDFIAKAGADDMVAGDPKAGAQALTKARALNATWRKAETIEDLLVRAHRNASSAGAGGNIDNAIRQQVKSLLNSKRARFFSKEERAQMDKLINGGKMQDFTRWLGKLSPEGSGASLWGHLLGGAITGGYTLPAAAVGFAAKRSADNTTKRGIEDLLRHVRGARRVPYSPPAIPTAQSLIPWEE
jgi:hypothetical protein